MHKDGKSNKRTSSVNPSYVLQNGAMSELKGKGCPSSPSKVLNFLEDEQVYWRVFSFGKFRND